MSKNIDWKNLGFQYMQTNAYVYATCTNGSWSTVQQCEETHIPLHIAATCLHYGQACFEGLKAFHQKDGRVAIFRAERNAERLQHSAQRMMMEPVPQKLFLEACDTAVRINRDYVPPYGTGACLYLRPLLIGTTPRVGLNPAQDFLFIVLTVPVGPYYKNGFYPVEACVQTEYDRAAPRGVGNVKAAGNYAASLLPGHEAKEKGYSISLYLDAARHEYIDEFGTSNFFGIMNGSTYVTPESRTILPSITNESLQRIAADTGLTVSHRPIRIDELSSFDEVGACGTATVITPVSRIHYGNTVYTFGDGEHAGEISKRLYSAITRIHYGEQEDPYGWLRYVD
jgi:branched-chain amino acid aminotransferase